MRWGKVWPLVISGGRCGKGRFAVWVDVMVALLGKEAMMPRSVGCWLWVGKSGVKKLPVAPVSATMDAVGDGLGYVVGGLGLWYELHAIG